MHNSYILIFHATILWMVAIMSLPIVTYAVCRFVRHLLNLDIPHRGILIFMTVGLTLYGGSKAVFSRITYPFVDPEVRYLVDNGSYVSNDTVHVSFNSRIVPSFAPLWIDRRVLASTNDTDWVHHISTTIGEFSNPSDITFVGATNYNWIVYTTWTPGPTVVTNGVLHVNWVNSLHGGYKLPIRTQVWFNADLVSPTTNSLHQSTIE